MAGIALYGNTQSIYGTLYNDFYAVQALCTALLLLDEEKETARKSRAKQSIFASNPGFKSLEIPYQFFFFVAFWVIDAPFNP